MRQKRKYSDKMDDKGKKLSPQPEKIKALSHTEIVLSILEFCRRSTCLSYSIISIVCAHD